MPSSLTWILVASLAGVLAGLWLVWRGLAGYRTGLRVADTSTSTISSAAAGEIRISGVIEPAELTLVSLLQSTPCVYYRASIGNAGDGSVSATTEERSVGFKVRDATGSLRIFPRGARVDAPMRFHEETGLAGDEPPGLAVRTGPPTRAAEIDAAAAIADLLTVRDPGSTGGLPAWRTPQQQDGRREYRETRLEPGDAVTVVGRALPFWDLDDPIGANLGLGGDDTDLEADPEVAADLAAAQGAGTLAVDAGAAWGNAAIPGFGIGRPVSAPRIDPAADPLPLATAEAAAAAGRRFEIAPDSLVIAASDEVPLLIAYGTPSAVVARDQARFTVGLLGAGLAIASALVLAFSLSGGLGA